MHSARIGGGGCVKSVLYRTLSVRDLYFISAYIGLNLDYIGAYIGLYLDYIAAYIGLYRRVHPVKMQYHGRSWQKPTERQTPSQIKDPQGWPEERL